MRIGIIGCGLIGEKRAAAASGHDIVLIADKDPKRAEALAARTGARSAKDWREVVNAGLDIVIVATTHDALSEIACAALDGGAHVLVEKPAGRNAAEARAIEAAADRAKRLVKVGFNHRFHPALLKAKEIFDSGALGAPMFVRGRYGHGGRPGYDKEWRFAREISGGGEALDQGSHLVDLSRWFLGDLELAFGANPSYFWNASVEDNCFLALKSAGGQIAWLHATWTEWKNMFSFEIYGRTGKLAIEGLGGSYGVERLTFYHMLPEMGPPETTGWEFPFPDNSWKAEFAEFTAAIAEGRKPIGNISDAVAMLEIIDRAYAG